jgi:hypothetical protein
MPLKMERSGGRRVKGRVVRKMIARDDEVCGGGCEVEEGVVAHCRGWSIQSLKHGDFETGS